MTIDLLLRSESPTPLTAAEHDNNLTQIQNAVNAITTTAEALGTTGTDVQIGAAAPPSAGQVLTATSSVAATWQTPANAAPISASYITLGTNATLTNERVLTPGTNVSFVDGGAGSTLTINVSTGNVSVSGTPTAGQLATWTDANTIQGVTTLPTAAVPAFTGDITNSAGSLATALATSGVTAGTYTKITVDAKGRATVGATAAASDLSNGTVGSGSIVLASGVTGTGNVVLATSPTVTGISSNTYTSTISTGTAPFTVASTTAVPNLNADKVDGYDATSFLAPTYLTLSTNSDLANERVLTAGTNITFNDGGPGGTLTINGSFSGFASSTNAGLGINAADSLTIGGNDVGIGYNAATSLTNGSDNVAVGASALTASITGSNMVAVGSGAAASATSGSNSVAVGSGALGQSTNPVTNVAVGYQAGYNTNVTGTQNTIIGSSADITSGAGTNRTVIGAGASGATDNSITLGNSSVVLHVLSGTGSISVPTGTTAQRNGTPQSGYFRYNTDNAQFECYEGITSQSWTPIKSQNDKEACRLTTVGTNITVSGAAPNTLDGVTPSVGDRILVKDQSTATQNGIYVVSVVGTGSNGTWVRAYDFDTSAKLSQGARVEVTEGTIHGGSMWSLSAGTYTLGSTNVNFTTFLRRGVTSNGLYIAAGNISPSGSRNTLIGSAASITTGADNTLLGYSVGSIGLTTSSNNTWVGSNIATGGTVNVSQSTAFGSGAMTNAVSNGTAFGYLALTQGGVDGTAIGHLAGSGASLGARATAVGRLALSGSTTGTDNTAVGYNALASSNSAGSCTAIGSGALSSISTSSIISTALGYNAQAVVTGTRGTAVGYQALKANNQNDNTAVGHNAMSSAGVSGSQNTVLGSSAGAALTSGGSNVAIGYTSLSATTSSANNVAIGSGAMAAMTGVGGTNIAIGLNAMSGVTSTQVDFNVAVGAGCLGAAGFATSTAVAVGYNALAALTSGANNTAVGYQALKSITTAGSNTSIGYNSNSGTSNTGTNNTAVGANTLVFNVFSGTGNVAVGRNAFQNAATVTASSCVVVGDNSYVGVTSGSNNVIIGAAAGNGITSGGNNVAIGSLALASLTTGSNNTVIGISSNVSAIGASNRTALGANASADTDNGIFLGDSAVTDIGLHGNAVKTFGMRRHTTAATAGNTLTITSGGAVSGGTNLTTGALILATGLGTGNAISGRVEIKGTSQGTASGTTDQTSIHREIIGNSKILTNNTATTVVQATLATDTIAAGQIEYSAEVFDGTGLQYETGVVSYGVTNKGGVFANNITTKFGNQQAATAGTLAVTWTISAANPANIQVNVNSSLTPATGYPRITYTVKNLTQQAIAIV